MNTIKNPPRKVPGRRVSQKERAAAFAKFEQLSERQQAIVYQELLYQDIANRWSLVSLASDRYHGGYLASPLHYGPYGGDALHVLVNTWAREREEHAFSKPKQMRADDLVALEKLKVRLGLAPPPKAEPAPAEQPAVNAEPAQPAKEGAL